MTAAQAERIVQTAYPAAYESTRKGWHTVYSGPLNRVVGGGGETSAKAWKAAAELVLERWPNLPVPA